MPPTNLQITSSRYVLRMCPGQVICFIGRMPRPGMPRGDSYSGRLCGSVGAQSRSLHRSVEQRVDFRYAAKRDLYWQHGAGAQREDQLQVQEVPEAGPSQLPGHALPSPVRVDRRVVKIPPCGRRFPPGWRRSLHLKKALDGGHPAPLAPGQG